MTDFLICKLREGWSLLKGRITQKRKVIYHLYVISILWNTKEDISKDVLVVLCSL